MSKSAEEPNFSAVLTPHRSLSPRGFLIFMTCVAAVSFIAGVGFLLIGAWPVFGFFGLDVLLIYFAFKLNYRAGKLRETVDLTDDTLKVTRIFPSGRSKSWAFNPYWARLDLTEPDGLRSELSLSSHGQRLVFGSFLSEEEKQDFAEQFGAALRACRTAKPLS